MTKKLVYVGILAMGLVFGLFFTSCESVGDFLDIVGAAGTGYAAGYSSTSDSGLNYMFVNRSSETIYFSAPGGYSGSLEPGESFFQVLNKELNVYNISYSPTSVKCTVSGATVTFTD